MAIPTIFKLIAGALGLGASAAMNRPRVSSSMSEKLKADAAYFESSSEMFTQPYISRREEMCKEYLRKLKATHLHETNYAEECRITKEIIRFNFVYLDEYFKKNYPRLK